MKNIFIIIGLLIINNLNGQNYKIEFPENFFKSNSKTGIIVSNNERIIVYEKLLSEDEKSNGFEIELNEIGFEDQYDLHIIEEKRDKAKNEGYPFFKIKTIVNVGNRVKFKKPKSGEWHNECCANNEKVKIEIEGVKRVNDLIIDIPRSNSIKYSVSKKKLKIEYQKPQNIDVYVLLRVNNESNYSYIYFPCNETNYYNGDISNVSKDIEKREVSLSEKSKWFSRIHARNMETGNYCLFYHSPRIEEIDNLVIYIPRNYEFEDYGILLQKQGEIKDYYIERREEVPLQIEKNDFGIESREMTSTSFNINLQGSCKVYSSTYKFYPYYGINDYLNLSMSEWEIIGLINGDKKIEVKIPISTEFIRKEFSSIEMRGQMRYNETKLIEYEEFDEKEFKENPFEIDSDEYNLKNRGRIRIY